MANRIQIRRGSGAPSDSLNYELGWDTTNKILYINDGGTDKAAALPLTGGIMTGNLTISKPEPVLYVRSTSMDTSTTTNSTDTYNEIFFTDKNGKLNGFLQGNIDTAAKATVHLGVRTRNSANDGNIQQHFSIMMAKDGTASTYFTHPAAWRAGLGLGSLATINSPLPVGNGGTGATTEANARANLSTPAMVTEIYPALLPTNGSNNYIKIGTANTSYGLLPSQGGNAGSGHNTIGTSSWYWKYAYIDEIYGHLNGNITGGAPYLTCPSLSTETDISSTDGTTRTYYGSGQNWVGSITSMAYAGILSVNGTHSRGWQIWASRGASEVLHWRNPNDAATAWGSERIILDSTNYSSYALPLSGGTITGTLRVGVSSAASSSSHSLWTTGIHVHDTRYDAISVTSLSHAANFFFSNNGVPSGSTWWAGMHLAGWEGDYSAWELVGPASNSDQRALSLCIRIGRTSNGWGAWRALVTSSDATARRIFVTTSASVPSGAANGDIVLVKV